MTRWTCLIVDANYRLSLECSPTTFSQQLASVKLITIFNLHKGSMHTENPRSG